MSFRKTRLHLPSDYIRDAMNSDRSSTYFIKKLHSFVKVHVDTVGALQNREIAKHFLEKRAGAENDHSLRTMVPCTRWHTQPRVCRYLVCHPNQGVHVSLENFMFVLTDFSKVVALTVITNTKAMWRTSASSRTPCPPPSSVSSICSQCRLKYVITFWLLWVCLDAFHTFVRLAWVIPGFCLTDVCFVSS